jgi:uncharacterized membrane protein
MTAIGADLLYAASRSTYPASPMNKSRLEAFSDGIFAVAITLLVLDIRPPADIAYAGLGAALQALLPKIFSYLLSFFVVGIYWAFHHLALHRLKRIDGTILFLNLLVLLLVTFMPFPTMLLGEFPFTAIPLVIYGACLIASNFIAFLWLLHLHRHPGLLIDEFGQGYLAKQWLVYLAVNAPYVAAMILAFFAPLVSYAIYIIVLIGIGAFVWRQTSAAGSLTPRGVE